MTDNTAMLDEIEERIETWDRQLEGCAQDLALREAEVLAIGDRIESLVEAAEDAASMTNDQFGEQIEEFGGWTSDAAEMLSERQERVEELRQTLPQMVEAKWEAAKDCCETQHDRLADLFEEKVKEATVQSLSDTREAVEDAAEECLGRIVDQGSQFRDAIEGAFRELQSYIRDKIIEAIEAEAKRTGEAALDRVKSEVVEAIVTSQAQAQITAMLSTILPQLVMAKAMAPNIRRALEIMRAGF